jgi:hypothetical protein
MTEGVLHPEGRLNVADAWLGRVDRPYRFASPFQGREFALLLVVGDADVTAGEQRALSEELVRQGCRYAVCFGHACSTWDDSIDMVGVMAEIEGHSPPFVMTTWHEHEALDEVVDFFVDCTEIANGPPERFVILLVGGPDHLERAVRSAVQRRLSVTSA